MLHGASSSRLLSLPGRRTTKRSSILAVHPCATERGSQAKLSGRVVQMKPYIAMSSQRASQDMFALTRPKKVNMPMMRTTCINAQTTRNTSRWFRPYIIQVARDVSMISIRPVILYPVSAAYSAPTGNAVFGEGEGGILSSSSFFLLREKEREKNTSKSRRMHKHSTQEMPGSKHSPPSHTARRDSPRRGRRPTGTTRRRRGSAPAAARRRRC